MYFQDPVPYSISRPVIKWHSAMPKRVLKGKLYATRRIGRPRIRWLEDVITDLRRMGISGWMEKARNRD